MAVSLAYFVSQFSASKECFISLDRLLITVPSMLASHLPFRPSCIQTSHLLVSAFQGLGMQAEVAKCLIFLYSGLGGVPHSRDWGCCFCFASVYGSPSESSLASVEDIFP